MKQPIDDHTQVKSVELIFCDFKYKNKNKNGLQMHLCLLQNIYLGLVFILK